METNQSPSKPITFDYPTVSDLKIKQLAINSSPQEISLTSQLKVENTYFQKKLRGTLPKIYARRAVADALKKVLVSLPVGYGICVFDAFRSTETQRHLFEQIQNEIAIKHPEYSKEQLFKETRTYVAHPDEVSRFEIAPHNSGGAIDLTLTFQGNPILLGTQFDEPTHVAQTNFFEQDFQKANGCPPEEWLHIRELRRLLFWAMVSQGFTNYREEWWHYDLGNCLWAQEISREWIYGSMEQDVKGLCGAYTA